ncbi:unnamed protein product [Staurois parvus]|uniref:Uncharacterized protein n=1 Tax=Staurois parvus TaxID=386267 RepID=A0ABN9BGN2_9NEOB|nr:unnamed protein product [Staurois parvus]
MQLPVISCTFLRWAELVGALLGTGGRNLRVALLGTDHQGTDHQCPDDRCRSPL